MAQAMSESERCLMAVAVGRTNDERPLVLPLLLFDAVKPLLNPSVLKLATFMLLWKGQRGLASLVIRFFFLYRILLVGSVSFLSHTNGMSRYAGICRVLWNCLACLHVLRGPSGEASIFSLSTSTRRFLEHHGSLPYSQKPGTHPHSELAEFSPHPSLYDPF